ncbi:MAG: Helix-turn-helix domain, partial [Cyanobacteria bacterium RYN_339]|nr:Helix-turn-helix domain [Cyanobacteria bacterium RYN_339]
LIAKYTAEAEAIAGRPLSPDEMATGPIIGQHDNPFAGEPNAGERYIKMKLAVAITSEIRRLGLKQREVAERVSGLSQSDVSQIVRGKLKGYSESRLMEVLAALGNNVRIVYEHTVDATAGYVDLMPA